MDNDKGEMPVLTLQNALGLVKENVEDFRRKLKRHEFDFDSVDEKGKSFLIHLVETMPNSDYIWVVLEYFADPNIKDTENDRTALHYACKAINKGLILALLFFGASTEIVDREGKKPFELCPTLKEELEQISDKIEKYKTAFIQLTRKRRKFIKKMFDQIDQSTKVIDDGKVALFNQRINNESEEKAFEDAKLFIEHARLFKPDFDSSRPSIIYEEFLLALIRIAHKHNTGVIDSLIDKFKSCYDTKNNMDMN